MDQSQTYIQMCDTPEVQSLWEKEPGDFYAGIKGVCPHDAFWKSLQLEFTRRGDPEDYWKRVQHARDGEQTIGVVDVMGDYNWDANCGCKYYARVIWLPRQDQLQEMLEEDAWQWLDYGALFVRGWRLHSLEKVSSVEQVGIRRFMWNKGKIWKNNRWEDVEHGYPKEVKEVHKEVHSEGIQAPG